MHCKRGDNSCSEVYDVTNLMIKFFQEVLKFMHMYKNYIVHDVQYYSIFLLFAMFTIINTCTM